MPRPRSVGDLRRDQWVDPPARPIFFSKIDDSHCDRIHPSLTVFHCFDGGHFKKRSQWLGKKKRHFAEYWLKELQESMDMCTGHRDTTKTRLKRR